MARSLTYRRVAGDEGPPFTVTDDGFETTGWTITLRGTKPSGEEYTIPAVVAVVGDIGAGTPAEYSFSFTPAILTKGKHSFDIHYANAGEDDFSLPAGFKMTLVVRAT